MKLCLTAFACLALSSGAALAYQDDDAPAPDVKPLTIGDAARPIDISDWVKGDKVTKFEDGHVYVVEFWATWCPPCRSSMPHISKLQEQYKDYKVTFIGVSDEPLETVTKFLSGSEKMAKADKDAGKTWNDLTHYTLTTDPDRSVSRDYMQAANQNGIPTAFVIGKDQHVEWIGHPMEIEQPLDEVVHDKWDRAAFKTKWEEQQAAEKKAADSQNDPAMDQARKDYTKAIQDKDWDKAVAVLDNLASTHADMADNLKFAKFNLLLTQADKPDAAYAVADDIMKAHSDDAMMLNQLAWMIVNAPETSKRDFDVALKAASKANEVSQGKDASILDTLAFCYFDKGQLEEAVKTEKSALALNPDQEELVDELKANLEKFEKALADKSGH